MFVQLKSLSFWNFPNEQCLWQRRWHPYHQNLKYHQELPHRLGFDLPIRDGTTWLKQDKIHYSLTQKKSRNTYSQSEVAFAQGWERRLPLLVLTTHTSQLAGGRGKGQPNPAGTIAAHIPLAGASHVTIINQCYLSVVKKSCNRMING